MGKGKKNARQNPSRRKFLWLLGGGALATGYALLNRAPEAQQLPAPMDPQVTQQRQQKLDELLNDPRLAAERQFIEGIVYNHGFEAERKYLKSLLTQTEPAAHDTAVNGLRAIDKAIAINASGGNELYMTTRPLNHTVGLRSKSRIYANEKMFDSKYVKTDEDRIFALLHEGMHAAVIHNGLIVHPQEQAKLNAEGHKTTAEALGHDQVLMDALMEVFAYGAQFMEAPRRNINPNPVLLQVITNSYNHEKNTLRRYAQSDDNKGALARAMLNSFEKYTK